MKRMIVLLAAVVLAAAALLPGAARAEPQGWPGWGKEMEMPEHLGAAIAPGERHFDLLLRYSGGDRWGSTTRSTFPPLSRPAVLKGGRMWVPLDFFAALFDCGFSLDPGRRVVAAGDVKAALDRATFERFARGEQVALPLLPLRRTLEGLGWRVEWRQGKAFMFRGDAYAKA